MEWLKKLRQHLLTGVSFAIPFIACGGILIALSLAFAPIPKDGGGPDPSKIDSELWRGIFTFTLSIGVAAFTLMLPVLAGYISNSIAGKPGLVAGMIGGWLAGHIPVHEIVEGKSVSKEVSAGFLGALVAGLLAGYIVQGMKSIPILSHKFIKPITPILIIPVVSSLVVGGIMVFVIGSPIAGAMDSMNSWLLSMQDGNKIILALILGAMIAFDMGGPVNKVAFFFASGLIAKNNFLVMGPVAAAICIPPLGLGLATLISKKSWSEEQRESGLAALGMGTIGITEGAIPFAASDPVRVIPCIMLGSMVGAAIAMLGKVGNHAPHGGLIVLPVIDNQLMYVIGIAAGVVATAVSVNVVKKMWPSPADKTAA